MKTQLFFSALALTLLTTACRKDEFLSPDMTNKLPASERCGCLPPAIFDTPNVTNVSAELGWGTMPEALAYRIEVFGPYENDAYVVETESNRITLANLVPDSRYQYRVTTICRVMDSYVSQDMFFETKITPHGDPGLYTSKLEKYGLAKE